MGVRGAVREKIKRQESLEKEKAEFKKKVKTVLGEKNIKSPSIKVENIWTRITSGSSKTTGPSPSSKSKHPSGEKHESQSIVQSVLLDLIHSLPSFVITTSANLLEENGFAKDEPEYEEVCKNYFI